MKLNFHLVQSYLYWRNTHSYEVVFIMLPVLYNASVDDNIDYKKQKLG